jgi:hypothetical protein
MMRLDRFPTGTSALLRAYGQIGLHIYPHILDGKPPTTLRAVPGHEILGEFRERVRMSPLCFPDECRLVALIVAIAKVQCQRPSRSGRISKFGHASITALLP